MSSCVITLVGLSNLVVILCDFVLNFILYTTSWNPLIYIYIYTCIQTLWNTWRIWNGKFMGTLKKNWIQYTLTYRRSTNPSQPSNLIPPLVIFILSWHVRQLLEHTSKNKSVENIRPDLHGNQTCAIKSFRCQDVQELW